MSTKPVLSPDGIRYESATAAAAGTGVCRKLIAKKAAKGVGGWSYADVSPTLVSKVEEYLAALGDYGGTVGEVAKYIYGGAVTTSERATVSATLMALVHSKRARKTSEMRKLSTKISGKAGVVYVLTADTKAAPLPAMETGAGNVRHRSRARRIVMIERDILPESETPQELARHADSLRHRYPVVPLKGGRWLVDDVEVAAGDVIALARGEVKLRELRG
jgi:hypothetical protein